MIFRFLLLSFLAWIVWRWAASLFRPRRPSGPVTGNRQNPTGNMPPPPGPVQELVQCPKCETWKSATDRTRCERPDCPY